MLDNLIHDIEKTDTLLDDFSIYSSIFELPRTAFSVTYGKFLNDYNMEDKALFFKKMDQLARQNELSPQQSSWILEVLALILSGQYVYFSENPSQGIRTPVSETMLKWCRTQFILYRSLHPYLFQLLHTRAHAIAPYLLKTILFELLHCTFEPTSAHQKDSMYFYYKGTHEQFVEKNISRATSLYNKGLQPSSGGNYEKVYCALRLCELSKDIDLDISFHFLNNAINVWSIHDHYLKAVIIRFKNHVFSYAPERDMEFTDKIDALITEMLHERVEMTLSKLSMNYVEKYPWRPALLLSPRQHFPCSSSSSTELSSMDDKSDDEIVSPRGTFHRSTSFKAELSGARDQSNNVETHFSDHFAMLKIT